MTVTEFVAKFPQRSITLRYFAEPDLEYGDNYWRAAFSSHYRMSDGMRRLAGLDNDDREESEGWGVSPDAAVTALAEAMLKKARGGVEYHQREGHAAETELAALSALLDAKAPRLP